MKCLQKLISLKCACCALLCYALNLCNYAVNILKNWKDGIIIDIASNSDD